MTSESPLFYSYKDTHSCSYLPEKESNSIFLSPEEEVDGLLMNQLQLQGFRRSGKLMYRPRCPECSACKSVRVVNQAFKFNRNMRKTLNRASSLTWHWVKPELTEEHYSLYEKYINTRHRDGDMYPPSQEQYTGFLIEGHDIHRFLEARTPDGQLLGCCVVDQLCNGLSAVYSYFDPDFSYYSPGSLFILRLIQIGLQSKMPYTYLGYWVNGSKKMEYKTRYQPLEYYDGDRWQLLDLTHSADT